MRLVLHPKVYSDIFSPVIGPADPLDEVATCSYFRSE
jgi:hypothetical protein